MSENEVWENFGRKKLSRIDLDLAVDKYFRNFEGTIVYISLLGGNLEEDSNGKLTDGSVDKFRRLVESYTESGPEDLKRSAKDMLEFLKAY